MGTEPIDKNVRKKGRRFTTSGLQLNQRLVERIQPEIPSVLAKSRYNKGTNQKEEYFMESIGRKIAFYRKAKGMTQEELSEKLGVSPQAVSKWENDAACPDIQLLVPLAKILEVTTDELLSAEPVQQVRMIPQEQKPDLKHQTLKVIVDSAKGDKVRVNLPMELVKIGLEIGSKIPQVSGNEQLQNIDFEQIMQLVESGVMGELVEIESADGDVVHVVVE